MPLISDGNLTTYKPASKGGGTTSLIGIDPVTKQVIIDQDGIGTVFGGPVALPAGTLTQAAIQTAINATISISNPFALNGPISLNSPGPSLITSTTKPLYLYTDTPADDIIFSSNGGKVSVRDYATDLLEFWSVSDTGIVSLNNGAAIQDLINANNRYGWKITPVTGATNNWTLHSSPPAGSFTGGIFDGYETAAPVFVGSLDPPSFGTAIIGFTEDTGLGDTRGIGGASVGVNAIATTKSAAIAIAGDAYYKGLGTLTKLAAFQSYVESDSGTVTEIIGFHALSTGSFGATTVANNSGVKVDSQTLAGATNRALWTALGQNEFGDLSSVPGSTGKTWKSDVGTTAPGTNPVFAGTAYYGGNGTLLGDPVAWELRNVAGVEYKCPLY